MSLKDVPIAPRAFPGLPIFLRRQFNWTSLVRLSDPCVSGGSTTITIVTQSQAAIYAQSPNRSLLAHLALSLSGGQNWSGVGLVAHILFLPALKATGFLGGSR